MQHKTLLFCSLLVLPLTQCTSINPYTGQTQASKTALGTGIGAVGGAVLGAVIGNNTGDGDAKKGALIGGGIGGTAGGGIGYYMDRQEAKIRDQLRGAGVSVTRSGNNILLNMPQDITFDVARDSLKSSFYPTLNSVALVLKEYNKTNVAIDGHTDSDGGTSYNQALSQRRASSVANYLDSKGVKRRRLSTRGYGESAPIASNSSSYGKAKNRRVELKIIPVESAF